MDNPLEVQKFLKNLTVLYVEDEEETVKQGTNLLSRYVGKLLTASNGVNGLSACIEHNPDIIISDIQMPIMDGLSMSRKIREKNKNIPIIILTAFNQAEYMIESIEIGIDKYVAKPVDGSKLYEALLSCAYHLLLKEQVKLAREMMNVDWQRLTDILDRVLTDKLT